MRVVSVVETLKMFPYILKSSESIANDYSLHLVIRYMKMKDTKTSAVI